MLFKSEWGVIEKWRSSSLSNMEKKAECFSKTVYKGKGAKMEGKQNLN